MGQPREFNRGAPAEINAAPNRSPPPRESKKVSGSVSRIQIGAHDIPVPSTNCQEVESAPNQIR